MAKTTRDRILDTILENQRCTINDLADAVGINPISVRHHIIKLEAEGFVTSEEERHGVGRPPKVYFLTEAGMEKFPTRYLLLTNRLLYQLKNNLPKETVNDLFSKMAAEVVESFAGDVDLSALPMEQRLESLKELLAEEGFSVEWEKSGDEYLIHEISCPYFRISENHPEVCTVDETLISHLLMVPAQRVNCVHSGDAHCTYQISPDATKELEIIS
jgi:predicted ArsR family transcriptional regulator